MFALSQKEKTYNFSIFYKYMESILQMKVDEYNDVHAFFMELFDHLTANTKLETVSINELLLSEYNEMIIADSEVDENIQFVPNQVIGYTFELDVDGTIKTDIESVLSDYEFTRLPQQLIIHFCRSRPGCKKSFKEILIRPLISITFMEDHLKFNYILTGLILHDGRSPLYGHFSSIVKANNQWWYYNDEKAYKFNEEDLQCQRISQNTIMAFYECIETISQ